MINKYDKKEKSFIELRKRMDEIYQEKRGIPYKELKEPIQDGWLVDIVLIEEALRRIDSKFMEEALHLCNRTFHLSKGNMRKVSEIRKSPQFDKCRSLFTGQYMGRITYHGPELHPIKEAVWKDLDPRTQKWFARRERSTISRWGGATHTYIDYVLRIPFYYLKLKVTKRILTKVQDINPKLLKEEAFIDAKLEEYWRKSGGRRRWNDPINDPSVKRRHSKDALTHLKKGEIETLTEYSKLRK